MAAKLGLALTFGMRFRKAVYDKGVVWNGMAITRASAEFAPHFDQSTEENRIIDYN